MRTDAARVYIYLRVTGLSTRLETRARRAPMELESKIDSDSDVFRRRSGDILSRVYSVPRLRIRVAPFI